MDYLVIIEKQIDNFKVDIKILADILIINRLCKIHKLCPSMLKLRLLIDTFTINLI